MNENIVPEDWRCANVTPIYKRKGKRSDSCNYRPVSLTSQICKIMEAIIRDAIVDHLTAHKLLRDTQHGFRSGHSCLTNLLSFLEEITSYVDDGFPVDVLYLDFSKAFDKVPHCRLIEKMKAHGIEGNVVSWVESWLTGRKQRVVVNGSPSEWSDVVSGVPQGSVLGPTLFIIYINDIDEGIASSILKFADDTKVFRKCGTVEEAFTLQEDLSTLYQWSSDWQMLFNADKCHCLHIGSKNPHYDYFLGEERIETSTQEKDLGVIIHQSLSNSVHVANAVKKANQALAMINKTVINKDKFTMTKLYKTLVRPHLEYCVQAWRPHLQGDINKIESVQRRATRMVKGLNKVEYTERLKRLNLTTLECRRLRGDLIETYKILNGKEELDPDKFFKLAESNTRGHELKLYKSRPRLDIRKYAYSQRTINYWNDLPKEIVRAESVNMFKNGVDKYLRYIGGLYISFSKLPAPATRTTVIAEDQ